MADIDTNVSNYTLTELLTIVGIDNKNIDKDKITNNTNALFNKFKNKDSKLADFFLNVQSELLQYVDGLNNEQDDEDDDDASDKIIVEGFGSMSKEAVYPSGEKQITDWFDNQYLKQGDTTQSDKITDRKQ